jgi:UDP-glucose 4-epimerase
MLKNLGHEVIGFSQARENADDGGILGDYTSDQALANVPTNVDLLFHFAWSFTPSSSIAQPYRGFELDVLGSSRLFDCVIARGCRRILFASSGGTVYGEAPIGGADESTVLRPGSPYAAAKVAVEAHLEALAAFTPLTYLSYRIGNPYGPTQEARPGFGIVPTMLNCALQGNPIPIYGDGSMRRDYIYIDDVMKAISKTYLREDISGPMNVGSGTTKSVIELAEIISRTVGVDSKIEWRDKRDFDIKISSLDVTRMKSLTNLLPRSLSDGIRQTIERTQ